MEPSTDTKKKLKEWREQNRKTQPVPDKNQSQQKSQRALNADRSQKESQRILEQIKSEDLAEKRKII